MKPSATDDTGKTHASVEIAAPQLDRALQSILMLAHALARQAAREDDAELHRDDDESEELPGDSQTLT